MEIVLKGEVLWYSPVQQYNKIATSTLIFLNSLSIHQKSKKQQRNPSHVTGPCSDFAD